MIPANDNAVASATAEPLRFLSVCSGIEAASVAWKPLGWQCIGVAEIEPFPAFVLAHHYGAGRPKFMPDPEEDGIDAKTRRVRLANIRAMSKLPTVAPLTNWGDFTRIDTTQLGRVDILAGGTPCQAFSVAGLRGGLQDARGNLTLKFVELAHELAAGNGLRNVVWENVVGVLSTKDNAFGCFLAGLVGADTPIEPPARGKWGNAGLVSGPSGRAAWRIQDAQYHGLAQRRRRVLVVADFGNGADPASVLFELDSVQRYSPPSREARKDVAPTISARTKGGGGLGTDFDLDGGLVEASTWAIQERAVSTNLENGPQGKGYQPDIAYTLEARNKVQSVAFAPEIARCDATREGSSQDYETTTMVAVDVAPTMRAGGNSTGGDRPYGTDVDTCDSLAVVAFDTTQITSAANRSNPQPGDPCHPLAAGAHPPAITVALRGREGGATAELGGEVATALRASSGGGDKPHVLAFDPYNQKAAAVTHPLRVGSGNGQGDEIPQALVGSAVRRLTPVECERLQGFPDNYTNIPWRGKPTSPDGPRYKALGNSWAVPKFTWLGRRIARFMPAVQATTNREAA